MVRIMRSQRGFTLVEVMVAVTIFSVGMLAIASLQISGMRHTRISASRTQAYQEAYSMLEEMRANQLAKENNFNDYMGVDSVAQLTDQGSCMADGADCTPSAVAELTLARWLTRLATLPEGGGIVCRDGNTIVAPAYDVVAGAWDWSCNPGPGALTVIRVGWRETNPPGSAEEYTYAILEVQGGEL